ncbi:efflux RND transporter permease subunit [Alteribacillus sp. JSM 102045]|uniref:efflux RND transporter permease subunit n=1 Tax=Alteribacillus sp. JSM 102045 TaxID=1562101 RepID=UPI0035C19B39
MYPYSFFFILLFNQPGTSYYVIPATIVGAVLGLLITQRELSIMSGTGVIMLIGIVLNNAILLIDRTNQIRRQQFSVTEALIEAGRNRIRPVLMTTLTTAGGMLPLVLASGTTGNYQASMAIVIISGLLFASLITLLLIPAAYRLFTAAGTGLRKRTRKKKKLLYNHKAPSSTVEAKGGLYVIIYSPLSSSTVYCSGKESQILIFASSID